MNRYPRFKYYTPAFEDLPAEPIYSLWIPEANGCSDVSGETLLAAGHALPPTPTYATWYRFVMTKQKCGRCFASVSNAAALERHNHDAHHGVSAYFPEDVQHEARRKS